ncbi:hypothetical protein VBD025_01830 [Virgibacillus flavescens]|uniref:hypothetical protein n=1 Tax=Virgibacillus flavescens TaxID=1611422 RepID=UPI003D3380F0
MQCPNCFQQTEQGKFCTNCGALIPESEQDSSEETAASVDSEHTDHTPQSNDDTNHTNAAAEKIKAMSANFGHFFLAIIKKPSDVNRANENDFVSGIFSIAIYSLLFAIGYYMIVDSLFGLIYGNRIGIPNNPSTPAQSLPFKDGLLWPFLKLNVLFLVFIGLTFAALRLVGNGYAFRSTVAKYGGYLMPLTLLLIVGYFLVYISLYFIGAIVISASILGAILIVPTLILLEQPPKVFDRIYLLIVIYILNMLAACLIMKSAITAAAQLLNPFTGGMMGP